MRDNALPFLQKLRYGAEAAVFFLFMALFRVIGLEAASSLGSFLARHLFSRLPPDRVARANLLAAFPEKSAQERDAIRMAMWDNLGRVVAEYPHLEKFSPIGADARITYSFAPGLTLADCSDGAGLFLSAHLGNWEMMPIIGRQLGLNGATVVRPPNNPYVADWIAQQRALMGPAEQIAKHNAMRRMFTQIRRGGSLYMLVDQKLNEGIPVPFFGRTAMTTPAAAALALKLGARIVYAANRRTSGSRFHVHFQPGDAVTPSGDEEQDIQALTQAMTQKIEAIIRNDPAQWLWIHNRWPRDSVAAPG